MNSSTPGKKITVFGAGLVGSLLSIYLKRQGYDISIIEKRPDPRIGQPERGRSINMALSHRGLRALKELGLDNEVMNISIPMKGRMIHDTKGGLKFFPYGEEGQMIYSVSRSSLNKILIESAEKEKVTFSFNSVCSDVDISECSAEVETGIRKYRVDSDLMIGADGAFSVVRSSMQKHEGFNYSQNFLEHAYKELHIPPLNNKHAMEKNALHIWPREKFMLIALPNKDGSFTCTLFLLKEGAIAFSKLNDKEMLHKFFKKNFPDVFPLMPTLEKDFFENPAASLVTIKCFPWALNDKVAIIGDAAHALVPFYGQGMNAGFEDCRILNGIIKAHKDNWGKIFREYQNKRKTNADAVADLSMYNFIEMRDLMGNPAFQLRKKIEGLIHERYPKFLSLYSMVTFSDIPYSEILSLKLEEDKMMEEILSIKGINKEWETEKCWKQMLKIIKKYF
jgi:kynurenine 3-monooxygenase